jgi:hypothetical protein
MPGDMMVTPRRKAGLIVVHALTNWQPPEWTSYARRVDVEMPAEIVPAPVQAAAFLRVWTDAVRRGCGGVWPVGFPASASLIPSLTRASISLERARATPSCIATQISASSPATSCVAACRGREWNCG